MLSEAAGRGQPRSQGFSLEGGWGGKSPGNEVGPRAAYSNPRSQLFTIRTDPKPVNNFFFFQALKRKKHSQKKNSRKHYYDRGQR